METGKYDKGQLFPHWYKQVPHQRVATLRFPHYSALTDKRADAASHWGSGLK